MPLVDAASLNAQSLNTREIVLRLDANQFECSVFYAQSPDPRLLNKTHIRLLPLPKRFKTIKLFREMLSGYDVIAYMDVSPASYLYLHLPKSLRKATKTVMHIEALTELKMESAAFKFLFMGIASRCDFYTGITEKSAQQFSSFMHREILCILPVGIDRNTFSSAEKTKIGSLTVLFVGTLVERKGPLLVLEAALRFPDIKFRIIGPDRHGFEQVLTRRMTELSIKNVVIEGAKPQELVVQAMRESNIFLLPSRVEGLPKVTLEAAACGLPCIVFDDYETPSVVDGVSGFQVKTIGEMMEKLTLLLKDERIRESMGAAGRKLVKKFDWDRVVQLWQNAYLQIAAEVRRTSAD